MIGTKSQETYLRSDNVSSVPRLKVSARSFMILSLFSPPPPSHNKMSLEFDEHIFEQVADLVYQSTFSTLSDMSRAKHWCFTLNNYTSEDVDRLTTSTQLYDYIIFGREIGASGTPHLQGFISFNRRVRLNQCTDVVGKAHCTVARNVDNSIEYCKKDGDYIEIGTKPSGSGTRNDLEVFKQAVIGGLLDLKKLRMDYSEVFAKYPVFCRDFVNDHLPKKTVDMHPLRAWQADLYDFLKKPADARKVTFVVDYSGNAGKSWFGHYYCFLNENSQVLLPGKKADMAYMLDPLIRVLFIDAPRSKQGEFIQYDFLEDVKNGYVASPKYESRVKQLNLCHVVVFMNEDPDMSKLSLDRYDIRKVSNA